MKFLLVSFALACTQDLLVDDFKEARLLPLDIETPAPMRYFNLLGGDYGIKEENGNKIQLFPNATDGYMTIYAEFGNEDTSESYTHPNQPNSHNYWYAKFDKYACFDLTPFKSIQFDLKAPAGSEMIFVLTQKSANCTENPLQAKRLIDSEYLYLKDFITPDGTKQTVSIPLEKFGKNLLGEPFDLKHLKDFTIVDIKPAVVMEFSNFKLVGDCTTNTTGSNDTPKVGSGALGMYSFLWLLFMLLV